MVTKLNKTHQGKAVIERSDTGYMTRELFNGKVLPSVLLPTLDRARRKHRFWEGEGNGHAAVLWYGPEVHELTDKSKDLLRRHET